MSIIGDIRDEMEYEMFKKIMLLISKNLEQESIFLVANPQILFTMEAKEMIDSFADIFGYSHEYAGKIFNNIIED